MKDELVKRQDLRANGNGARTMAGAVPPRASGSAYPISEVPAPRTIPLSGLDGRLDPTWLPDYAADTGYGETSPNGQTIVAPWMRLLQTLGQGDLVITVSANTMAIGDQVMLSHAARQNERATIVGGPRPLGSYWQYDVQRRGDGEFPTGSKVYDLGLGWATIVSGDQADYLQAPHINLWTFVGTDGTVQAEERRLSRWGRLSGLSAAEKAYFPNVTDWSNVYGLYTDNLFARGWIYALGGHIAGDFGVTGRFTVKDPFRNARFEIGDTAGGWGAVLRNDAGRPVWGVATAYPDENGVLSDVAWWVESYGERAVWFRYDAGAQDWVLSLGGFEVQREKLSYEDFVLDAANKRVRFGTTSLSYGEDAGWSGLVIDLQYDQFFVIRGSEVSFFPFMINASGNVFASEYSVAGSDFGDYDSGAWGSFTSADGKTVTVKGGIIVGIV